MVNFILSIQGGYYILTALWPILHVDSFESIVGAKPDKFQLFTTTYLILVIGITLLLSTRQEKTLPVYFLSIGSALSFMIIEAANATRIRPVFWADFAIEGIIVFIVIASYVMKKNRSTVS